MPQEVSSSCVRFGYIRTNLQNPQIPNEQNLHATIFSLPTTFTMDGAKMRI